jgi:threonine/homoserine/homoserine lactone efflux protein
MLEIILFSFGIMYTPGPLNILSINQGVNKRFKSMFGFFVGVGVAMMVWLIVIGYSGERFVKKSYIIYISIIGALYIVYLAYKVLKSSIDLAGEDSTKALALKDGFLLQLFNPKAPLAVLPLATIIFPANGITGYKITIVSILLSIMAGMAPCVYGYLGERFSYIILNKRVIKLFNGLMAFLLVYVAITIIWDHVYLVFTGVKPY